MSRLILLCVETNKQARTDYKYIDATIKRFYKYDRKIIYRPIFLGTKTKYNAKDKVKEINEAKKDFLGQINVIYFIDVDDSDISSETKNLYEKIQKYCQDNKYDFVYFNKDIEDVYLGYQVSKDEKVNKAEEFTRKKLIDSVNEANLNVDTNKQHTSNILKVLDLYWTRKDT